MGKYTALLKLPTQTKKLLYGINKDFSKKFDYRIIELVKEEINSNWCSLNHSDIWLNDFGAPELKGWPYTREIPQFLISSFELRKEVKRYNITAFWHEINRISKNRRTSKTEKLRKKLSVLGESYYSIVNIIPEIILSNCEHELANLLAYRKNIVKHYILSPFNEHRNAEFHNGLMVKCALMFNVILGMAFLKLISRQKVSKTLANITIDYPSSKDDKIRFFNHLNELSESLISGHDERSSVPSFSHLFGIKIYKKIEHELSELEDIRAQAAPLYIEYLLCQYASFDIKPRSISFGKEGHLNISLPNPKLFLVEPELTEFENEILSGYHDTGAYKESIMLSVILKYFSNSKNDLPIDVAYKKIKYRFSSIKHIESYPGEKATIEKLKKISQTNSKKGVNIWLKGLSNRLSQNS